ncbi:adenosylmethionine decarboxylase [Plantactinospora sp. WMMB782]|uniref:adenosylmethionine decarboxylase n=1 Tax=Plantactinospora sp. WMMB782 TaxID=3404121 RepID=UPI003B9395B0
MHFSMERVGKQFSVDARGADPTALRSVDEMRSLTHALAEVCHATVLNFCSHVFEPTGGITALAILSSSHVALHTWPELQYLAVDVFCCSSSVDEADLVEVVSGVRGRPATAAISTVRPLPALR